MVSGGCRSEGKILVRLVKQTVYPGVESAIGRVFLRAGHTVLKWKRVDPCIAQTDKLDR